MVSVARRASEPISAQRRSVVRAAGITVPWDMTPPAITVGGPVLDIAGAVILAFGLVLKTPEAALERLGPWRDWNPDRTLCGSY